MESGLYSNCPLCSSSHLKHFQPESFSHLAKCKKCKFIFDLRIPDDNTLLNFYEHYPDYPPLSGLTIKRYNEILNNLKPNHQNGYLLDVGCGHGFFLDVAKEAGWETYGTEFTSKAVKICESKGHKMHAGSFNKNTFPGIEFDIITSFEVVEHVREIREHLEEYGKHLRHGGTIYITTPNFNSLSRILLKNSWRVITYPEHLNYFTGSVLSSFFENEGFRIHKLKSTGFEPAALIHHFRGKTESGDNSLSEYAQTEQNKIREDFESGVFKPGIKKLINFLLSSTKSGDTIKLTATKIKD